MIELDGYRPGALAGVVALNARYYASHWGFGIAFETKVAGELAQFLPRMREGEDLFLNAYEGEDLVGSITLDASGGGPDGAHLRWFIVAEAARGSGLGSRLMREAMRRVDAQGLPAWLTTFAGLDPARRLYERHGFALAGESESDQWQGGVREQRFQRGPSGAG